MKKNKPIKIYLCLDCTMPIGRDSALYGGGRCSSCGRKNAFKLGLITSEGKNNIHYKDGRTMVKYFCVCGTEISWKTVVYGKKTCQKCKGKHYPKGKNNHNFGIKWTEDQKERHSIIIKKAMRKVDMKKVCENRDFNGKNNPNWRDGISFEEYGAEFDNALKEQIRFRDRYKCRICGCSQIENGRQLDVHHKDYNKKNSVPKNLISLCQHCHIKTNYNRKYWKKYFRGLLCV